MEVYLIQTDDGDVVYATHPRQFQGTEPCLITKATLNEKEWMGIFNAKTKDEVNAILSNHIKPWHT